MKKINFNVLALAILFVACEKEQVSKEDGALNQVAENNNRAQESTNLRIWYDDGTHPGIEGVNYGCKDLGGTCANTVDVPGIHANDIANIVGVVDNGNIATIRANFANNESLLGTYISPDIVQGVITGNLTVQVRGFNNLGAKYLVFKNGQSIIYVAPLSY